VRPRTQDSIAFSADGEGWNLVNASPDVRAQIEGAPALHPRPPRTTPIRSIVLTNGDLDHVLGLFSLRESTPLEVWATDSVRAGLEERNAIMRTLHRFPEQLTWKRLELGKVHALGDGASVEARSVAGKAPVHLTGLAPHSPEDNVALWIRHGDRTVVYAAACASLAGMERWFDDADVLFLDGTFWSSDELVARGLSRARAEDMAHLPIGGPRGSLAALAATRARRKIYTHLNNSNPILVEGSDEQRAVVAAGWEIAFDGMEVAP
jgi:pyrroloquinoline quinone biosynthesis protein B